jgi:uncharacterized repeat protein (TIGR04138 family)
VKDQLRQLALSDGRYSPEAFAFLFASLEHAVRLAGKDAAQGAERHVTGQELLAGLRENAIETFGPLAAHVWRAWGIKSARDWGTIVFLLVDASMLKRKDSDKPEDFDQGFDFDEVFVERYRPPLPRALEARPGGGENA